MLSIQDDSISADKHLISGWLLNSQSRYSHRQAGARQLSVPWSRYVWQVQCMHVHSRVAVLKFQMGWLTSRWRQPDLSVDHLNVMQSVFSARRLLASVFLCRFYHSARVTGNTTVCARRNDSKRREIDTKCERGENRKLWRSIDRDNSAS